MPNIEVKKENTNNTCPSDQNLHNGHRERLRKRFMQYGGADFSDHELLEMLLFYAIPRKNTNELAHLLINEFGSLRGVCLASHDMVARVKGVGESTVTLIALLSAIRKRVDMQRYTKSGFSADSLSRVGEFLVNYHRDLNREEFSAMFLDNSMKLIDFVSISAGSVNSASVDVRSLARLALLKDASYVILSHNHPSGILAPSANDNELTFTIEAALHSLNITLFEHIIVNDISYIPTLYRRNLTLTKTDGMRGELFKRFYET